MNEATQEQLSALLDGELPSDELRFLMRRLEVDADLARRWSRFQIAGAVLRREQTPLRLRPDFVAAVIERLDAEVVPVAQIPLGRRVLRWAAGGAIAASVAVAALVASRPPVEAGSPGAAAPLVAASAPVAAAPAAPVGELHRPLLPQVLPFADYAQPASFESMVPNYAPAQRQNGEAFVPYVLVVAPRQSLPQQAAPRQDASSQQ